MKNITLSAPEELIEAARRQALKRGVTLNHEFRLWLKKTSQTKDKNQDTADALEKIWQKTSYVRVGKKLSRDEMNER